MEENVNVKELLTSYEFNALKLLFSWLERRTDGSDSQQANSFGIQFEIIGKKWFSEQDVGTMARLAETAEDLLDADADSMGMEVNKQVKKTFSQLRAKLSRYETMTNASPSSTNPYSESSGSFLFDAFSDLERLIDNRKKNQSQRNSKSVSYRREISDEDKRFIRQLLVPKGTQPTSTKESKTALSESDIKMLREMCRYLKRAGTSDDVQKAEKLLDILNSRSEFEESVITEMAELAQRANEVLLKEAASKGIDPADKDALSKLMEGQDQAELISSLGFKIEDGVLIEYTGSDSVVRIPSGVTRIGNKAFYRCDTVTSIIVPSGVTSIGACAFSDCEKLRSVTLPSGVTSIEYSAFSFCESLTSIVIPDGVTSIGDWAFSDCENLIDITIPDSVIDIGSEAFSGCKSLRSNIVIPDGVRFIGGGTFEDCKSLKSIIVPDSVIDIGENAFKGCRQLTVYGSKNSAIRKYARWNSLKQGFKFVAMK